MTTPSSTDLAPRVLLTGFDAFGGGDLNPSQLIAQTLQGEMIAGHQVVAGVLPTAFGASMDELKRLIRAHRPALVICVGQAGGRAALSLERIAINIDDARIKDNAGKQPVDEPVVAGGPAAYFNTLPIKAMLLALKKARVRADVSQTAGTFVCNHVFYGLMHLIAKQRGGASRPQRIRAGFIHVPWLPEQGSPSMSLNQMVKGLRVTIECAVLTKQDVSHEAGALN